MLALWSCGRRVSVVEAQRQIHRAPRAAFTIAETVVRTIAEQPALAVPSGHTSIGRHGSEHHSVRGFSAPLPSADAAVSAAARRGRRRATEPATVRTIHAMYATALPRTIPAARSSLPRMDRADAVVAWASLLLRWSGVPRPPSMPCAARRGIAPKSARQVSPFHRERAYPQCRRAAAAPHEFAVVDELGPTWRAARSPGVGPPHSSGGLITAVDRVCPAGDSASSPVPHHASSRPA